jgi:hypothetical protein
MELLLIKTKKEKNPRTGSPKTKALIINPELLVIRMKLVFSRMNRVSTRMRWNLWNRLT